MKHHQADNAAVRADIAHHNAHHHHHGHHHHHHHGHHHVPHVHVAPVCAAPKEVIVVTQQVPVPVGTVLPPATNYPNYPMGTQAPPPPTYGKLCIFI